MVGRLIAFMSDFGLRDPYVAIVHAVIDKLSRGSIKVIDIVHEIPEYSITSGAYILYTSYKWFPEGTVFLVVVDPGVGSSRRAVAIKTNHYWFVGPDNGVLWQAINEDQIRGAWSIENTEIFLKPVSRSFHGRDVFAPAAVHLALGKGPQLLGRRINPLTLVRHTIIEDSCNIRKDALETRVIYIDRFGNAALSTKPECIKKVCSEGERVIVKTNKTEATARCLPVFSLAEKGELVLYVNSLGFPELAINLGNAAKELNLSIDSVIRITKS